MELILVRHAIAFARDSSRWPDDADRPLTPAGVKRFEVAAAGISRLVGNVDLVLSSPFSRAWHTARILSKQAGWPEPIASPELEPESAPHLVLERVNSERQEGVVALVSHEPLLGTLVAYLLAGEEAPSQPLKKGGAICFVSPAAAVAGGMQLRWCLTPKVLRLLAQV